MARLFKMFLVMMVACLILCVVQLARSPEQVVRQYLSALKKKDYRAAYSYLTPDTQGIFSLQEFAGIDRGYSGLDENNAEICWQGVFVSMKIKQDPASWGYLLVKSKGKWKIVIREGSPSFPYVKDYFCGNEKWEY
jgi:hypothetical protein